MRNLRSLFLDWINNYDPLKNCQECLLQRIHENIELQHQIEALKLTNSDLISKLNKATERCELLQQHIDEVYIQGGFYFDALKDVRKGIEKIFDSIVRYENKKFPTDDATPPTSTN